MPSGIKASVPTGCSHGGGKRDVCKGWSLQGAQRNDLFLRSIDPTKLTGVGFAFSLTVRTCPETHARWERMRRGFLKRLERMGLLRLHWLTEWQPRARRGEGPVPHLHAVAFFDPDQLGRSCPPGLSACAFIHHWLDVAAECEADSLGQHVSPVRDAKGWFGYLAKHGARGVFHYQRQRGSLPLGWQKTGRMWGKSGSWPVSAEELQCTPAAFYALRRAVDRLRLEDARRERRKAYTARKMAAADKRIAYLRDSQRRVRSNLDHLPPDERVKLLRHIGQVSAVSEWCDPGQVVRWLNAICTPTETVDSETGEVLIVWGLK